VREICMLRSTWRGMETSYGSVSEALGAADKAANLERWKSFFCQLPVFGRIAYPVRAEATKHDKPGCKSLGCPAEIFAAVGATWEASKLGGLNIKKCLQPRELTAEKSRSRIPTGSRPKECLGKADDTEEETGKCTRWDRRGRGPGIRGQICRDNVGIIPVAAGAGSNLRRLHERGQKPKSRRATRDWRMSP
jgi:hypothetical protein